MGEKKHIFVVSVSAGLTLPRAYMSAKKTTERIHTKGKMDENRAKESEDKGECEQSREETTLPPSFF
jgi:hypothetical protein